MNILKVFLIFAIGSGAGASVASVFWKKKCEELVKQHDLDFAEMDRYYKENCENCGIKASLEEKQEDEVPFVEDEPAGRPEKRQGSFATPYGDYYKTSTDPSEKEHPEDDEEKEVVKVPPKVIKKRDFGFDGYSTRVLYYYTVDDALIPEESTYEDIIDTNEVKDMIGNTLDKFNFRGNDDDEMYVRNANRNCDYHIIKVKGSLSEDYGG